MANITLFQKHIFCLPERHLNAEHHFLWLASRNREKTNLVAHSSSALNDSVENQQGGQAPVKSGLSATIQNTPTLECPFLSSGRVVLLITAVIQAPGQLQVMSIRYYLTVGALNYLVPLVSRWMKMTVSPAAMRCIVFPKIIISVRLSI